MAEGFKETREKVEQAVSNASLALATSQKAAVDVDEVSAQVKELSSNVLTKSDAQKLIKEEVSKAFQTHDKATKATGVTKSETVAVVGGLDGLSNLEEAQKWLQEEIARLKVPVPIDVWITSGEFKGVLKARFSGPDAATTAITAMMKQRPRCKGKPTWCKHDQPILKRAPLSFLFGLKKELVNWDIPKACTYIDEESATMQVEGAPVLHVCSKKGELKLN